MMILGKELRTIMTKNNLTDIWREKNPSVKKYTFRRGNSKSRIDLTGHEINAGPLARG